MLSTIILGAEAGATNGPIIPHDPMEVLWGGLAFAIVIGLIAWKGGPGIKAAWNTRLERLEGELADASSTRAEADASLADVEGRIANADAERQRILAEARQTAESLRAQLVAKAEQDAADAKARAAADIESAKSQVIADLQAEVGALALGAAEAVVAANLDAGTQNELIESYITKVGSSS